MSDKSKVVFDVKANQLKEARSYMFMLDMYGESKAAEVIKNLLDHVDKQQAKIDKLQKVVRELKSESISIAAWVARETQGDDYTEKMQTRFFNNVVKKLKNMSRTNDS